MASWTSVQIATLVVEALTPITVAGLGAQAASEGRRPLQTGANDPLTGLVIALIVA